MVRCADCGFLAGNNRVTKARLIEVDIDLRNPDQVGLDAISKAHTQLVCLEGIYDLVKEAEEVTPSKVQSVVHRDRPCQRLTKWIPGLSPKEHREMEIAENLRRWQDEQKEKDRRWQEEQRQSDRNFQLEMKAVERQAQETQKERDREFQASQNKANRVWGIVASLVAVIVGALLGAF